MVSANTKIAKEDPQIESDLAFPPSPPLPHWLKKGVFYSTRWEVADDNSSSPKPFKTIRFDVQVFDPRRPNEVCHLTDPEYATLLIPSRFQIYGLRTGKHATVTTAKVHEEMARAILNQTAWIILHGMRRRSDLDQKDFEAYAESALYGPGHLLMYADRLAKYIKDVKNSTNKFPSIVGATGTRRLHAHRILENAGIDPARGKMDKPTMFQIWKLAEERGLYLNPNAIGYLSEDPPQPEKLVTIPFLRMLQPWDYQWRMRHDLPGDRLQFNPFSDKSPDQMAMELGRKQGRTLTAPVPATMELIECALRWVFDYSSVLLEIRDYNASVFIEEQNQARRHKRISNYLAEVTIPEGLGRPFPLNASIKNTVAEGLDIGTATLLFIPVACAVILAAFDGRRRDEVTSIRAKGPKNDDCISRDEDGLWLETYIEKGVQSWERTPCNEASAAAIEILRRWSEPARELSGSTKLFQYKPLISDEVVSFDFNKALKLFVDFLGLDWKFKPHQLRRFFAILYFWHYQYRHLPALSYHLRHPNPLVTIRYVTEADSGAIFRHVNKDYTTTILTEAALGERNVSGPFGERFKRTAHKLRDHYRRITNVISPKLVHKVVARFVEKSGRRLKAMLWGYCACGTRRHQLRAARCLRNSDLRIASGPDFSQSSPAVCGDCPHHVTENVFEPFVRIELNLHKRAAADPNNAEVLREISREHVDKLQRQYDQHFSNSKPLEKLQ